VESRRDSAMKFLLYAATDAKLLNHYKFVSIQVMYTLLKSPVTIFEEAKILYTALVIEYVHSPARNF